MEILGLLSMYFDATVVFVTNSSLLFRLAMANGHTVGVKLQKYESLTKNLVKLQVHKNWK